MLKLLPFSKNVEMIDSECWPVFTPVNIGKHVFQHLSELDKHFLQIDAQYTAVRCVPTCMCFCCALRHASTSTHVDACRFHSKASSIIVQPPMESNGVHMRH